MQILLRLVPCAIAVAMSACSTGPGGQCECPNIKVVTITVLDAHNQPLTQFRGVADGVSIECPPSSRQMDGGASDAAQDASDAQGTPSSPSAVASCSTSNAFTLEYLTQSPLLPSSIHIALQSADGSESIDQDVALTLTTDTGCCGGPRGSASVMLTAH